MTDLLTNNKTCPEESIYQIGTVDESISGEMLAKIATEFFDEMEEKFGTHVHILDWALHLDEGTPHIHERHVFDCKNNYGELCPQQEKALEELGVPLPNPDKKKAGTTTANRPLMRNAGRCFSVSVKSKISTYR